LLPLCVSRTVEEAFSFDNFKSFQAFSVERMLRFLGEVQSLLVKNVATSFSSAEQVTVATCFQVKLDGGKSKALDLTADFKH
jgi:hypothetical protein